MGIFSNNKNLSVIDLCQGVFQFSVKRNFLLDIIFRKCLYAVKSSVSPCFMALYGLQPSFFVNNGKCSNQRRRSAVVGGGGEEGEMEYQRT